MYLFITLYNCKNKKKKILNINKNKNKLFYFKN